MPSAPSRGTTTIERLVVYGASGDLTSRYLVPALVELHQASRLPEGLQLLGVDRAELDDEGFRDHLRRRSPTSDGTGDAVDALLRRIMYRRADVTDPGEVASALDPVDRPSAVYVALPPAVAPDAVGALSAVASDGVRRVVMEKPFGEDLASARRLNRLLHETFPEPAVFRVDHFLHLQTVQNVLGLRFANRVLEPLWSSEHVAEVSIVWDETLALEGRAGYYDANGALRDMVQNHLLQLLCLVAMERPATLGEADLRDRKVELLRAVRPPAREAMAERTIRARYEAGEVDGRRISDYADEEGVDADRGTETFAEVVLEIDTPRWADVPFRLRTGKALARDRHFIELGFRPAPQPVFAEVEGPNNRLRLEIDPDRLALDLCVNGAGDPFSLEPAALSHDLASQNLPAYARLLAAVLEGDPRLSIRDDEAEESWRIVEPVLEAWGREEVPLLGYPAGSDGPRAR